MPTKLCPFCAEEIQEAAILCKHCGKDLASPFEVQQMAAQAAASTAPPPQATKPGAVSAINLLMGLIVVVFALLLVSSAVSRLTPKPETAVETPQQTAAATEPPAQTGVAPVPTPGPPASKWHRQDGTSKMDDSKTVVYAIEADNEIAGWLARKTPVLIVRCKERSFEAYMNVGMSSSVEYGDPDRHTVQIRFDDSPARSERWSDSSDNNALFAPNARRLAQSLAGSERLRIGFTPFNADPVVVEFSTAGFAKPLKELIATCAARSK